MNAIALVLAVRFTLLVAVAGAIFLAYWASSGDWQRLVAVGIYAACVVIPVVALCAWRG